MAIGVWLVHSMSLGMFSPLTMIFIRYLMVLTLVAFASETRAQMPILTLEHLTTKEGLPSNDVWTLFQDKKGFLWIGTGRNICRYDGYSFLRLDSMQLGYCSGIGADSKGNIYTSVDTRGLCKIDVQTMDVKVVAENNYNDKDPSNDLHEQSLVDRYDQVWVCDYASIKRYDIAQNKLYRYKLDSDASGGMCTTIPAFSKTMRETCG